MPIEKISKVGNFFTIAAVFQLYIVLITRDLQGKIASVKEICSGQVAFGGTFHVLC